MVTIDPNESVWKRWEANAERFSERDAIIHWKAEEEPYRWTFGSLLRAANAFSVLLHEHGVMPGDVCSIIIRHHHLFYPVYMGIVGCGAIPCILAYPNPRLHPDKFRQGLTGMSKRSGLDWILTERDLEPTVAPLTSVEGSTIKGIMFPLEWSAENSENVSIPADLLEQRKQTIGSSPFLLQHSSGTTGLQKPILLSNKAILVHVAMLADALSLQDSDCAVSWLPLYHDMGLIAALQLPLAFGFRTVQIDPFEWVLAPVIQMQVVDREKASLCWMPNFAFNFLAQRISAEDMTGMSLSSLRMIINAAEPIRDDSLRLFYDTFKDFGLREDALCTMYGMAETTLSLTQSSKDIPPKKISVDAKSLSQGRVILSEGPDPVRVCVCSGVPIVGTGLRIVDENKNDLSELEIGEIVVSSLTMFDGYRNYQEKTDEVLKGEWLFTGDLGFLYEKHIFVIGRKKDIIIVAGKNIYPEDVEYAVGSVEGIIPGRVLAFGFEDPATGTEALCVIAETALEDELARKQLRMKIIEAGMAIDFSIVNTYFVPSRWLIKSSSGKPSRSANKERIFELIKSGAAI